MVAILAEQADNWGWANTCEKPLDGATFRALLHNEVPAVRVPRFLTPGTCAALAAAVQRRAILAPYRGQSATAGIFKLGPMLVEYAHEPTRYNEAVRTARAAWDAVFAGRDPVRRVARHLRTVADVSVGISPSYHDGVVQNIEGAMALHADFAPLDAPGWALERVQAQVAWLIHLRAPASGGETLVYNRFWCAADEQRWRVRNSYHYADGVVAGAQCLTLPFVVGDLVLFNSRNYHTVLHTSGGRMTVGAFIGHMPDGSFVMWS